MTKRMPFGDLAVGQEFRSDQVGPHTYKKLSWRKALSLEHGEEVGRKHDMTAVVKPDTMVTTITPVPETIEYTPDEIRAFSREALDEARCSHCGARTAQSLDGDQAWRLVLAAHKTYLRVNGRCNAPGHHPISVSILL